MDKTSYPAPPRETNWTKFSLIPILLILGLIVVSFLYLNREQKQSSASEVAAGDSGVVTITKDGFVPAEIRLKVGGKITWVNKDSSPHNVFSDPHPTHNDLPGLTSDEDLATEDRLVFTFEEIGVYGYHDELNPNLKGKVIVE